LDFAATVAHGLPVLRRVVGADGEFSSAKKGESLSGNGKAMMNPQGSGETVIGPGVRVEGNVTFAGVLRNQGEIIGDMSCGQDPQGRLVVAKSGSVDGSISAAHVAVAGRVRGNVHAAESLEIGQAGHVIGDASYKEIVVHAGGVIEGLLTPMAGATSLRSSPQSPAVDLNAPPDIADAPSRAAPLPDTVPMPAAMGSPRRKGRRLALGTALVLLIAVAVVSMNRKSPSVVAAANLDDGAAEKSAPPSLPVPKPAPAASAVVAASPSPVIGSPVVAPPPPAARPTGAPTPATASRAAALPAPAAEISGGKTTEAAAPAPHEDRPEANPGTITTVQGNSPDKSADFLFVTAKEAAVLIKKKRDDPGEGTRIELAKGNNKRIAIAADDLLRVAQGRNLGIFFQGRKVGPKAIQSGAWMSFVPYTGDGAGAAQ
jgi:cytoskeletal protein CcmA (bactofilin family)